MLQVGDTVIAILDALPVNLKNLSDIKQCTIQQGTVAKVILVGKQLNNTYLIGIDIYNGDKKDNNTLWLPKYWASSFQLMEETGQNVVYKL